MVAVPRADDVVPPAGAEADAVEEVALLQELLPGASEATRSAVAAVLAEAERQAAEAWPGVRFPPSDVVWRRVLETVGACEDVPGALGKRHLRDLILAIACAAGEARAMRWVDEQHLAHIGRFVRKLDDTRAFADEVRQVIREKIFLGGETLEPKIAEYGGVGPLEGWLRVVAVRTAQNLLRARKPGAEPPSLELPLAVAAADPELLMARTQCASTFRACFADAVAALSAEERTLLLLHYLDGLSSDAIARMYGLGGATVRRRIAATRARLLADTRRRVGAHLRLPSADVDHVWAELRSGFDLSLSRILRGSPRSS
jgi:RNA polymerase sigma-70 factor, ECF subfamily